MNYKILQKAAAASISMLMLVPSGIYADEKLVCQKEEHTHDESCYENVLICNEEETPADPGHTHTDLCYQEVQTLICDLKEDVDFEPETENSESPVLHKHDADCFKTEKVLICPQQERPATSGHIHTEECYEKHLICQKEEHIHTDDCYEKADLVKPENPKPTTPAKPSIPATNTESKYDPTFVAESAAKWESTLPDHLSGNFGQAVLQVARSQIGTMESKASTRYGKGWSRYGAWYGIPYGDWCAMFVSFCIHYAGVPATSMPLDASCPSWRSKLIHMNLWRSNGNYNPQPGDLIFYDYERDGLCDHVGLVESVSGGIIHTIEGNIHYIGGDGTDMVMTNKVGLGSSTVMGFGLLSKLQGNPNVTIPGEEKEDSDPMTFEGENFTVTVMDDEELDLPEDAKLNVIELKDEDYDETLSEVEKASSQNKVEKARFFKIGFESAEKDVEIDKDLKVKIVFHNRSNMSQEEADETVIYSITEEKDPASENDADENQTSESDEDKKDENSKTNPLEDTESAAEEKKQDRDSKKGEEIIDLENEAELEESQDENKKSESEEEKNSDQEDNAKNSEKEEEKEEKSSADEKAEVKKRTQIQERKFSKKEIDKEKEDFVVEMTQRSNSIFGIARITKLPPGKSSTKFKMPE